MEVFPQNSPVFLQEIVQQTLLSIFDEIEGLASGGFEANHGALLHSRRRAVVFDGAAEGPDPFLDVKAD